MTVDLVVHGCTVATPYGRVPDAGVAVSDGTIVTVGRSDHLPIESANQSIDGRGNLLVPGLLDTHIHNREPGLEYKEDWESASKAAAAGGITTVVGMPNTDPAVDRPSVLNQKFESGAKRSLVDFQSFVAVTSANLDQIESLDEAGALGYKIFLGSTVGDVPPPTDGEILEAMERIAPTGKRLGFHEENGEIIDHYERRAREAGRNSPLDHARSRPVIAEVEAIERMITFADETGVPIHMFHVSSGSGAAAVQRGKDRGVDVTAETCPHYLWFTEAVLGEKGNVARVQPPIRTAAERDLLWDVGIDGSAIDLVATDHAPHTAAEKLLEDPFGDTWEAVSGFVGLETAVPALLTFVAEGRLSLERWVDLHARRPAQVWGMYPQKGSLQVGTDADLTLVDPDESWTLEDRHELHSKDPVSPFVGERFTGRVHTTIVRGEVVYRDGEFEVDPGYGTLVEP